MVTFSVGDKIPNRICRQILLMILVGASVWTLSQAGVNRWTSNGPGGGTVVALAIDPTTPSTLYAAGPIGGVFKSVNGGDSWVSMDDGLPPNPVIRAIAVDPANPAAVYVGILNRGIFKSNDGGTSWVVMNGGIVTTVSAIVIDPTAPNIIYAGSDAGVLKTVDRGNSWAFMNNGLSNTQIFALAIDPTTTSTLYAGTPFGVFKTTDGAAGWAVMNNGISSSSIVFALAIDPSNATTLYCTVSQQILQLGAPDGVFRSTDGAANWSPINNGLPSSPRVSRLVINPLDPSTIYVGGGNGVFKTTDQGASWTAMNDGLFTSQVLGLAVDPSSPATVYAAASAFGGTGSVFKSIDGAGTWQATNNGFPSTTEAIALAIDPESPETIYAGLAGGVFKSNDSGMTWFSKSRGLTSGGAGSLAIDPSNPATLYAGTGGDGIFKSVDGGESWSPSNNGLGFSTSARIVRALIVDPFDTSTVYAGTERGPAKTSDGGANWIAMTDGLPSFPSVLSLALDPIDTSNLYAGLLFEGVFKSTDGGAHWTRASNGISRAADGFVRALAIDPISPATIYAGTDRGGIFKSIDAGANWTEMNSGLPRIRPDLPLLVEIRTLAVDAAFPNTVFAGTSRHGIFRSDDGGENWQEMNNGLSFFEVRDILIAPTQPRKLYAATLGGGVIEFVDDDSVKANLSATKQVDGDFFPRGQIVYSIVLSNAGPGIQRDNPGDEFRDVLPLEVELIRAYSESGTTEAINFFEAGTTVERTAVSWNGSIPALAEVAILIEARIVQPTATGIVNQGTVHFDSIGDGTNESSSLTDDPSFPGTDDPTPFPVQFPIPVFNTTGFAAMWLLVLVSGLVMIYWKAHRA